MKTRVLAAALLLVGIAFATREWTDDEFDRFHSSYEPQWLPRPGSLIRGPRRYNYLERFKLTCEFVASYQVSDSGSPDFGGIIEAEHLPGVIETDNTQEAIWIWSRWYEITGRDDFRTNIERAWNYVLRYPAYQEHGGNPGSIWYAVWNCGLGFMAETRYRHAYADSSYLVYAESCRAFYIENPLDTWSIRDNFVTGQSSGMAYDYAIETADQELSDTALARGAQVRAWIEADAQTRLSCADWAMSGATAMWGVCQTVCREDTAAGKQWIETYADSLPGFYPGGTWNCSHNIWLANAYRACAELNHEDELWLMHQHLVDTLIQKDTDRDGGIPATLTDPETQDQTWVSTYLLFMGIDVFVTPTFDHDVSLLEFVSPAGSGLYLVGDTVPVSIPVANVGLNDENSVDVRVTGPGYNEATTVPLLQFLTTDTLPFASWHAPSAGTHQLYAIAAATGDQNPLNDTARVQVRIHALCTVDGSVLDSAAGTPVSAWLKARIKANPVVWDSARTDPAGNFTLNVIDTTFVLSLEPDPPYHCRDWELEVRRDTTVTLLTQTAHLMVVNNDSLGQYTEYYTSTLDTLGVTHFVWFRPTAGIPPYDLVPRLRTRTIIWFTGDSRSNTVPSADQDSLTSLAATGLNLLLTGQNIAEDMAGTEFLEQLVGCRFDSSGYSRFFVFGSRQDSLGALIHATATAGGNGAGNQTSRDMVTPLGQAAGFMVYDTVSGLMAGTRRSGPETGTKVILLGFGFEAVNRPISRPDFLTRVELMAKLLDWLGLATGIREPEPARRCGDPAVAVWPNPFTDRLFLRPSLPATHAARVSVHDVAGRRLARFAVSERGLVWMAKGLAPGVYFLRSSSWTRPVRVLKIR